MMFPQVISGACLLALLIVQICCYPAHKKVAPGTPSGDSDRPSFAAPYAYEPPGHSPGSAVYNPAPAGVHAPQPAPAAAPVFPQPAEAFVSSGALPANVVSGGSYPVGHSPSHLSHPSPAFVPGVWDVEPFRPSGGPSGTSSRAESLSYVSPPRPPRPPLPPLPPPEPAYQAGELSQYERNIEDGVYETETEEQGHLPPPPPPPPMLAYGPGQGFISQPRPPPPFYGGWGFFPYYNYRFLYGQYPPGTYTHVSSDFEHGSDNWQDAHYERYYVPYASDPGQQTETFTSGGAADPQRVPVPSQPANDRGFPGTAGPSGYGSRWYRRPADPAHGHTGGSKGN